MRANGNSGVSEGFYLQAPILLRDLDRMVDLIDFAKENDEHCRHILGQVEVIRKILNDLQKIGLTEAVKSSIDFLCDKLVSCDQCMDEILDQDFCIPRQVLRARKYRRSLRRLRSEINSAVTTVNMALNSQLVCTQAGMGPERESETSRRTPSRPENVEVVKRAHDRIKLSWETPNENAECVAYYEVHCRRRWKKWFQPIVAKNDDLVVSGLSADTKYWFRVRAVSNEGYVGRFSSDIPTETKFSKLARRLITTGAAIGGTFTGPVIAGIATAYLTSQCESSEEKAAMTVLGVTSVAATAVMPVLGTLSAGLTAHLILAPDDFSDED